MKHNKNLEQRTFLQDRFEILIKKQQAGTASFLELTELDDIVNRHAVIRDTILQEMQETHGPSNSTMENDVERLSTKRTDNLLSRLKSFFCRLVNITSFRKPPLVYSILY